jgi:PadR family transcriptional regulator, regulatory protein PadR
MAGVDWPTSWMRGTLDVAVLAVVAKEPVHGYAVAQELARRGLGPVRGAVLYPTLTRLESEGLVSADWVAGVGGPGRKVHTLTPRGRTVLEGHRQHWHEYVAAMADLLAIPNGSEV